MATKAKASARRMRARPRKSGATAKRPSFHARGEEVPQFFEAAQAGRRGFWRSTAPAILRKRDYADRSEDRSRADRVERRARSRYGRLMGASPRITVCVMVGALAALRGAPGARGDGLDAERFVPAIGDNGTFVVEHPAVPAHLGWTLGLFLDYADNPLVVVDANKNVVSRPLATSFSTNLTFSLGLFQWAELGVALPLHLVYEGDAYTAGASSLDARAGLGDLRVMPKFALVRSGDLHQHVLLGLAFPVSLPTGNDLAARGADGVTVTPELLFALHLDRVGFGVDAGYRWRAHHAAALPWGDEIVVQPWAQLGLTDALTLRGELPIEKEVSTPVTGADFTMEVIGGLDYAAGNWDFLLGAGRGLSHGIGDPEIRVIAGLRYRHAEGHREGFGDSDGDGIPDKDDRAPNEAEDEDGYQDEDGAPDPDNDGDGIPDEEDECPELAGDRAHDGCPPRTYVKIEKGKVYIFGKVQFRTGSAEIDRRSEPLLDQIAQALQANPDVHHVVIEGHTDNKGGTAINQRLSEERAASVKAALVKRGVDGGRLSTRGYGETRPIAPNKSPGGRAKNRRVDFVIPGGGR
jgi:outer membrane protein OmpA-like peptidoglycan-associated protein